VNKQSVLQLSFDGFPHYNPLLYATELEEKFGIQFDSLPTCSSITKYMLPRTYDIYGSSRLGSMQASSNRKDGDNLYSRKLGGKRYEITDHLGNVHAVISDRKLWPQDTTTDGFQAEVLSRSDYYPFGMHMPGRTVNPTEYAFGFIGAENDNDVYGISGGSQNHTFRQYNSRLGRYISVDPLAIDYPWNSPYAYAENRVIDGIDLEGREYESMVTFQMEQDNKAFLKNEITQEEWEARGRARLIGGAVGAAGVGLVLGGAELAPIVAPHLARGALQLQAATETGIGLAVSNPEVTGGIIGFGIGLTPIDDTGMEIPFSNQPSFEAGKAAGQIISNFEFLQEETGKLIEGVKGLVSRPNVSMEGFELEIAPIDNTRVAKPVTSLDLETSPAIDDENN